MVRRIRKVLGVSLATATESLPLTVDDDGVIRAGRTRVTLDTVIAAFLEGATAEEIARQYPSLDLADVYSVIGQRQEKRQALFLLLSFQISDINQILRASAGLFGFYQILF